jgi:hypothetical protein
MTLLLAQNSPLDVDRIDTAESFPASDKAVAIVIVK